MKVIMEILFPSALYCEANELVQEKRWLVILQITHTISSSLLSLIRTNYMSKIFKNIF